MEWLICNRSQTTTNPPTPPPVYDILNHCLNDPPSLEEQIQEPDSTSPPETTPTTLLLANKKKKGTSLLASYGYNLSNEILLTRFGFTYFSNISDTTELTITLSDLAKGKGGTAHTWDQLRLNSLNQALIPTASNNKISRVSERSERALMKTSIHSR